MNMANVTGRDKMKHQPVSEWSEAEEEDKMIMIADIDWIF